MIAYYCSHDPLLQEGDFGVHEGTIRAAKATNSSLPYIVSLGLTYLETKTQIGHVCAGTVIQPDAILTSAREFPGYDRLQHAVHFFCITNSVIKSFGKN